MANWVTRRQRIVGWFYRKDSRSPAVSASTCPRSPNVCSCVVDYVHSVYSVHALVYYTRAVKVANEINVVVQCITIAVQSSVQHVCIAASYYYYVP